MSKWHCISTGAYYSGSNIKSILYLCSKEGMPQLQILVKKKDIANIFGDNRWEIEIKNPWVLKNYNVNYDLIEQGIITPHRSKSTPYLKELLEEKLESAIR